MIADLMGVMKTQFYELSKTYNLFKDDQQSENSFLKQFEQSVR